MGPGRDPSFTVYTRTSPNSEVRRSIKTVKDVEPATQFLLDVFDDITEWNQAGQPPVNGFRSTLSEDQIVKRLADVDLIEKKVKEWKKNHIDRRGGGLDKIFRQYPKTRRFLARHIRCMREDVLDWYDELTGQPSYRHKFGRRFETVETEEDIPDADPSYWLGRMDEIANKMWIDIKAVDISTFHWPGWKHTIDDSEENSDEDEALARHLRS